MKANIKIIILARVGSIISLMAFCWACGYAYADNAKEITLLYSGQTHAMIYHCNCPIEPDGGVAKRATLFKEAGKESPQVLILDSGDFSAGGAKDEFTQDVSLDKQRTLVNLKAMEQMRYDAAAVGEDEFNSGMDFFNKNIAKAKFNLLSCNIRADNVSIYSIKDLSGIKVGIIGVTNPILGKRVEGLAVSDPKVSLQDAVIEARKKGAVIIIVLSNLGESEDLKLLEGISGVDILIVGNAPLPGSTFSKAGKTILLRTAWQGRSIGKASFVWENNKIGRFTAEELRVSPQVNDDAGILSILPHCFADYSCKKEGFTGFCENPGTLNSRCTFKKAKQVSLTIVTARDCITCNFDTVIKPLKLRFPGLDVKFLYYPDKKAQEAVQEFSLMGLPAYIIGKKVSEEEGFADIKNSLDERGNSYLLKAQVSGIERFLNRDLIKGKFDVFLSLYDKDTAGLLEVLKDFKPDIHFLARRAQGGFDAARGDMEAEEDLRSVCVQKYYPQYFWDYLICRAKKINSSWWESCLGSADTTKIKACATGIEGAALLMNNIEMNSDLQVMVGPVYLLNNQEVFSSKGVPTKKELNKILKR